MVPELVAEWAETTRSTLPPITHSGARSASRFRTRRRLQPRADSPGRQTARVPVPRLPIEPPPPLTGGTAKFIAIANVLSGISRYAVEVAGPGITVTDAEAAHVASRPARGSRRRLDREAS